MMSRWSAFFFLLAAAMPRTWGEAMPVGPESPTCSGNQQLKNIDPASVPSPTAQDPWPWARVNDVFNMTCAIEQAKLSGVQERKISRAEVMKRAQEWVEKKIPYCQCNGKAECCGNCPHCGKYRCDCSGYVSYAWDLSYGYTTETLPQVAHRIEKHELKPGDIMLNVAEHVVIFGGWADKDQNRYHAFQEPGCHTAGPHYAMKSEVPYPMDWDPSAFHPYRYELITD